MIVTDLQNLRSTKQIAILTAGAFPERYLRYLISENVDGFREWCCVRTRGRWFVDVERMRAWIEANTKSETLEEGSDGRDEC